MTNEQMHELADAAANEAVRHIQDALGVTNGHFAGLYFSGDRWDVITAILQDYIRAEVSQ